MNFEEVYPSHDHSRFSAFGLAITEIRIKPGTVTRADNNEIEEDNASRVQKRALIEMKRIERRAGRYAH